MKVIELIVILCLSTCTEISRKENEEVRRTGAKNRARETTKYCGAEAGSEETFDGKFLSVLCDKFMFLFSPVKLSHFPMKLPTS